MNRLDCLDDDDDDWAARAEEEEGDWLVDLARVPPMSYIPPPPS